MEVNPESALRKPPLGEIASIKRDVEFLIRSFSILPNPDPVLKKLGRDISEYEAVLSDAHVFAVLTSRKAGVVSCPWRVVPAGDSRSDKKIAGFINEVLSSLNLYEDLRQALSAIWFGYSVSELIWAERDGMWKVEEIRGRSPKRFRFDPDGNPRLLTPANPYEGEPVPPLKFLVVRHDPNSDDNPYGEPLAARCYWPWFFKKHGWKFWAVFAEKYGMPHVWGKHPPGASEDEKQKLLDALTSLVQDGATVTADNQAIEILDTQTRASSTDAYKELIEAANREISKAVLGQTLTTEIGDRGSYAAAQAHLSVRADIVEADAQMLMSAMNNQLVRWLVGLNFGWDVPPPRFVIDYEEEDYKREKAERDKILWEMGYPLTQKYISETYGVPLPTEGEGVLPGKMTFSESQGLSARQALLEEMFSEAAKRARGIYAEIRRLVEKSVKSWKIPEDSIWLLDEIPDETLDELSELHLNTALTTYLWGKKGLYDQLGARFAEAEIRPMKPKEALDHFRELIPVLAEDYYALEAELRPKFFTVSRIEALDVIADVHRALYRALEEGKTLTQFQEEFDPEALSSLSDHHLETVFRTNIQTAYYAGYREALSDPGMAQEFPYLQYITAGDDRVRPAHAAMDGYVAPINDPIWKEWFPPNGFNCRCDVIAISRAEAVSRGLTVGPPPGVRPDEGFDRDPSEGLRGWGGEVLDEEDTGFVNPTYPRLCAEFSVRRILDRYRGKCRPLIEDAPASMRIQTPELLPADKPMEFYYDFLASEFGKYRGYVHTALGLMYRLDSIVLLEHLKKDPARLRFLPLLKPTLRDPYEVWFGVEKTERGWRWRLRHIGLFRDKKKRNYLAIIDLGRGGLVWTAFPVDDPGYMDKQRRGTLIYARDWKK